MDRMNTIKLYMKKLLGKGAYGEVKGDGRYAVKNMVKDTYATKEIFYLKNEISCMVLLSNEFDFVKLIN